jgi:hypothetical protein
MKTWIFTLITGLLLPFFNLAQEVAVDTAAKQPLAHEKMRTTGNTLKIVGGVAMLGGLIAMTAGANEAVGSSLSNVLTRQPVDENAGEGAAIAGGILFFGGVALLITGIVKTSKAKKMKAAAVVRFQPYAPPMKLTPKATIPQNGFTIGISIGK